MNFIIARSTQIVFAWIAGTALALSCSSKEKDPTTAPDATAAAPNERESEAPQAWRLKMQELSAALRQLLPLVADPKEFSNPKNDEAIRSATAQLRGLSHQVNKMAKPSADPAFDSIAGMLDEDLARALSALNSGNRDYARLTIRESMGYCIQCHTQTATGPSFPKLDLGYDPSKLSPLGRGDYYAATRQFDAALEAYRSGAKDASYAKQDVLGWERATRSGMTLAVRYHENPKEARQFAKAVLGNKNAPQSLRDSAGSWMKAIDRWSKEKVDKKADKVARAEKLITEARKSLGGGGHEQDILFLRASALLHKWLAENPKEGEKRAAALFLAGEAAEATRELNFWTLHERYYEDCINAKPKSDIAKRCFEKIDESVKLGYTGSSGTHLPPEEMKRLASLREKAY